MCIVVPGKVLEVRGDKALVEFRGKKRGVSLKFLKARKGDYLICMGDVAAEKIPKEKALEILEALDGDK